MMSQHFRKEATGKVISDIFTFNLRRILHPLPTTQ